MANPLISVIVKSYQRPFLLRVCLESIQTYWGNKRSDYEVIIADDGTEQDLMNEFVKRHRDLYDKLVHSGTGQEKWQWARQGQYDKVFPTCGMTWNTAQDAVRGEAIFLIEDDSFLIRPSNPVACVRALQIRPDTLCLIGLKERLGIVVHTGGVPEHARVTDALQEIDTCLTGFDHDAKEYEEFALLKHPIWPWSFDGIFYRTADWNTIGKWPMNIATGPMEGFIQNRLRELNWLDRHYGMTKDPICAFDGSTSVRTDNQNYKGRFKHVDAINQAWLAGTFNPSFEDVRIGRYTWDLTHPSLGIHRTCGAPMQVHYPKELRQINFVTGHELCGELHGAEADARWLSQANAEAERYGDVPWSEVPESCRST